MLYTTIYSEKHKSKLNNEIVSQKNNILVKGKLSIRFLCAVSLLLSGCSFLPLKENPKDRKSLKKYWHAGSERPYAIKGRKYYPQIHYKYSSVGYASWYGYDCHGLQTATGRRFSKNGLTAAHRTLPLPSVVEVENLENGKKIKLLVNDRGPYAQPHKRIIDVSQRAATLLGFRKKGAAKVRVTCIPKDSVAAAHNFKRIPYK